MTYLFLGNKTEDKSSKIEKIKSQYLKNKEARHFDCVSLYADKLDNDTLKKSLIDLPAVAQKRIVVVRLIEKLNKDHQRIIEEFIEGEENSTVLILDSDRVDLKNAFINKLKKNAEVFICDSGKKENVFDMTRNIERKNNVSALKILFQLVADGEQPVRILGAMVWFWADEKQSVAEWFSSRPYALAGGRP